MKIDTKFRIIKAEYKDNTPALYMIQSRVDENDEWDSIYYTNSLTDVEKEFIKYDISITVLKEVDQLK